MAKRILHRLKLNEISAVDRPAQEHARMVIMKRAKQVVVDNEDKDEDNEDMTEAELKKRITDLEGSVSTLTNTVTTVTKDRDSLKAENDALEVRASFDGDTLNYFAGLSDKEQNSFLKMSKTLRDASVATFKASDEEIEVGGQKIRKSQAGNMWPVLKAQATQAKEFTDKLAKSTDAEEKATLQKRVIEEFNHLPGTTEERASVLKHVLAIKDEPIRKAAEAILKTAEAHAKANFSRKGYQGGDDTSGDDAESKLNKLAKEYQKANKGMTFEKAYTEVCQENRELYNEYLEENKESAE